MLDGPPLRPARMESTAANPLSMFFSDRKLNIDPPPAPGSFGVSPRQPFSINATENLSVSIGPLFGDHQTISITISVFQSKTTFQMERLGNLYVGKGPPLGPSPEAVYILAFTGIFNPPA